MKKAILNISIISICFIVFSYVSDFISESKSNIVERKYSDFFSKHNVRAKEEPCVKQILMELSSLVSDKNKASQIYVEVDLIEKKVAHLSLVEQLLKVFVAVVFAWAQYFFIFRAKVLIKKEDN